jgi:DNA-binding transcriptional LysR family regulator
MDACAAAGFRPRVTASCRNIAATLELVRAGFVVTVLPMLALRSVANDPDFRIVPLHPISTRQIFVAMSQGMHNRPSYSAILTALDEIVPTFS